VGSVPVRGLLLDPTGSGVDAPEHNWLPEATQEVRSEPFRGIDRVIILSGFLTVANAAERFATPLLFGSADPRSQMPGYRTTTR
jgi:hypothetical protein